MIRRLMILTLGCAIAIVSSQSGWAQTKKIKKASPSAKGAVSAELRFRLGPFRPHVAKVESVENGTLVLREMSYAPSQDRVDSSQPLKGNWSTLTEGIYLGLTGGDRSSLPLFNELSDAEMLSRATKELQEATLFRVEVKSIQPDGTAVANVGAAGKYFSSDSMLELFRPPGIGTAEIKSVPQRIPLEGAVQGSVSSPPARAVAAAEPAQQLRYSEKQLEQLNTAADRNLRYLGLALHSYADANKQFPPAVVYGPDGKPWHSWRVLLLPNLDRIGQFKEYRFEEPWDSPNNIKLQKNVPEQFCNPLYGDNAAGYTHVAFAVGKGTMFSPDGIKLSKVPKTRDEYFDDFSTQVELTRGRAVAPFGEIKDPTKALLAGPISPERKIPWTKPEDVEIGEPFPQIGDKQGFAADFGSGPDAYGLFLYLNGNAKPLSRKTPAAEFREIVMCRKNIPADTLPAGKSTTVAASGAAVATPAAVAPPIARVVVVVLAPGSENSSKIRIDLEALEIPSGAPDKTAAATPAAGEPSAPATPPDRTFVSGSTEIAFPVSDIRLFQETGDRLSITPDGKRLAMSGRDNYAAAAAKIRIYDVTAKKVVREFEEENAGILVPVALSPDGRRIVYGGTGTMLGDVETGKVVGNVAMSNGDGITTTNVAFAPNGKSFWAELIGGTIVQFDAKTGKEIRTFSVPGRKAGCFSVFPAGKLVAIGYRNGGIRTFDIASGKPRVLEAGSEKEPDISDSSDGFPTVLAATPDEKWLFVARFHTAAELWDLTLGKKVREFNGKDMPSDAVILGDGKSVVFQGAWRTAKGGYDYSREGNPLNVFDIASGERVGYLAWPDMKGDQKVWNIAVAGNGKTLYVSQPNGTVKVFNVSAWTGSKNP